MNFVKKIGCKKIVLVIVILITMLFIATQHGAFNKDYTYDYIQPLTDEYGNSVDVSMTSLIDEHIYIQDFKAEKENLKKIELRFQNTGAAVASGNVVMEIKDSNGNMITDVKKPVSSVSSQKKLTSFEMDASLDIGNTYQIVVRNDNIVNENGIYVFEGHKETYNDFSFRNLAMIYVFLMLTVIVVLLPLSSVSEKIKKRTGKEINLHIVLSRILFLVSPLMAYWLVEKFSGHPLSNFVFGIWSLRGVLNIFIYIVLMLFIYLLVNRTKYTSLLMIIVGFAFGFINYILVLFRSEPLMAVDFGAAKTAANVAGTYQVIFDLSALWAITYFVIFACLILCLDSYKGLKWKKRLVVLVTCIGLAFAFNTIFFSSTFLKDKGIQVSIWKPTRNYFKNGSALSFMVTVSYFKVDKPDGYSVDAAEQIAQKYISDINDNEGKKDINKDSNIEIQPNVICIMNETFADLRVIDDIKTSEEFMPFVKSLEENTVKGNLYVSVFGGKTANSEFEFLTGNSMMFFPFFSIPYNNYINSEMPSLTYNLKEQGYVGNEAVHPFNRDGWNRPEVYPLLGFENFISIEGFENAEYIRSYISDKSNNEKLIELYEKSSKKSDEPFYVFNVTMQNHGGYYEPLDTVDHIVEIEDPELKCNEAELYLSLIKESDSQFEQLVNYFKQIDDPTIIVMFGDHEPNISDEFYEALYGKSLDDRTLEETFKRFITPYVIWANYDIEEANIDMSLNYLSSYLLDIMGAELSGYNKYLLDLHKKVPIISYNGYMGDDGIFREPDEESKYSELINEYKILQYNNVFDSENRIDSFFSIN